MVAVAARRLQADYVGATLLALGTIPWGTPSCAGRVQTGGLADLCRRLQFTDEPANISGFHRIRRYDDFFDMIAFGAMPLRCEFLPFLRGSLIGCVFGAFLAASRFQVIFLRQIKLWEALICGHLAAPWKGGSTILSVAGKSRIRRGDASICNFAARRAAQHCSPSAI
jgi:hypothetical protein